MSYWTRGKSRVVLQAFRKTPMYNSSDVDPNDRLVMVNMFRNAHTMHFKYQIPTGCFNRADRVHYSFERTDTTLVTSKRSFKAKKA